MDFMKIADTDHELVRVEFTFLKPGAEVEGTLKRRFERPPYNCFWMEEDGLYTSDKTQMTFIKPTTFVRITAIGYATDGTTTGEIDFMMSLKGAKEIMKLAIEPLYQDAIKRSDAFDTDGSVTFLAGFAIEVGNHRARPTLLGIIRMDQIEQLLSQIIENG